MPSREDVEMVRLARREINRRPLDTSRLDVYAMHGVVYLRGAIEAIYGHDIDLKHEMERVAHTIRLHQGVREVVLEIEYPRQ